MSTRSVIKLGEVFNIKYNTKNASLLTDVTHFGLDLLGLIPGIGEPFDAVNAAMYIHEKDWMFAALSLISVLPTIGDLIGKACKAGVYVVKAGLNAASFAAKFGGKALKAFIALIKEGKAAFVANRAMIETFLKTTENSAAWIKYKPVFPMIHEALSKISALFDGFAAWVSVDEEGAKVIEHTMPV